MNHIQHNAVLYIVLFYGILFCNLFLLHFIIFHNLWGPSKFHRDLWLTFICQMPGSVHQPWIITDNRRVLYIPYYMTIYIPYCMSIHTSGSTCYTVVHIYTIFATWRAPSAHIKYAFYTYTCILWIYILTMQRSWEY